MIKIFSVDFVRYYVVFGFMIVPREFRIYRVQNFKLWKIKNRRVGIRRYSATFEVPRSSRFPKGALVFFHQVYDAFHLG
jgi:hypothetical protein